LGTRVNWKPTNQVDLFSVYTTGKYILPIQKTSLSLQDSDRRTVIPGGTNRLPLVNIQCHATMGSTQSADNDQAATMSSAA